MPSVIALANIPESVELVQTIGEVMTSRVVSNVPDRTTLWNWYGPTEVSIASTLKDGVLVSRLSSIGRPLENVTCYVVDPETG